MIEEWNLFSTNLHRTRDRHYEVAVLPVGATEPHNFHLPHGIDVIQADAVAKRCCRQAWEKCQAIMALPPLPYGVDCNLMAFPYAIHVSQAVLDAMIGEIIASLAQHEIRKIVIVNGHGGNEFKPLVRQIQSDLDVHVFLCNWWQVGLDRYKEIFDEPDNHAGEMETSAAMTLCPDLVEFENAASGQTPPTRFEAVNNGWIYTSRDFGKMNDHCAVGNPAKSSAEKGRVYLDLVCGRLTEFLIQLAQSPLDETFPLQIK